MHAVVATLARALATAFALAYGLLALRTTELHFLTNHSDATLEYSFVLLGLAPMSLAAAILLWRDARALRSKPEVALRILLVIRVLFAGGGLLAAAPLCTLVLADFILGLA